MVKHTSKHHLGFLSHERGGNISICSLPAEQSTYVSKLPSLCSFMMKPCNRWSSAFGETSR